MTIEKTKFFLHVSETFYSIQGEGQTIGIPAVFLRLTGCNLDCVWCDSVEVWKKGHKIAFEDVLNVDMTYKLKCGAHLIITGGEPMLQQNKIAEYLEWFEYTHKFYPIVEIETNGTIIPNPYLKKRVDYWNVSPKLENSNEPHKKRVKEIPLREFGMLNSIFKFVISDVGKDILEMLNEYDFLDMKKVVLMPAGSSQEELKITVPKVVDASKRLGLRYSPRIHIDIWNQKTGV